MNATAAGPKGTFMKGSVVRLDDTEAEAWVTSGAATYVDKVQEVEQATVTAPERAVIRRVKRRRKKK